MYAPLQILSSYSLLKNPNTIEQILQTAKSRGYEAVALTDVNVMYGAVAWYRSAQKYQIKPLFGLTLMVNGLVNTATTFPLVLIAENQTGYQNLMWLSSARMTNDSVMLFSTLVDHLSGINVILPSTSELSQLISAEYEASAGIIFLRLSNTNVSIFKIRLLLIVHQILYRILFP